MPVLITFDIEGAESQERRTVQSFFERFSWENLGGSCYRYPRLGSTDQPVEDWLNHVVPALMLFRTYFLATGRPLSKFTLDVQSSSGFSPDRNFGAPPLKGKDVKLYPPKSKNFGKKNLVAWLDGINNPYSPDSIEEPAG